MTILSALDSDRQKSKVNELAKGLSAWPVAQKVLRRIASTIHLCPDLHFDLYAGLEHAVALAHELGISTIDEAPSEAFSWDGLAVRTKTETAVLLHEIAHWQVATPQRRVLPDFGLGAGPETGHIREADAAICVDYATKEEEEDLASLLGILWEVEQGGPAIIAFCVQNWLELADRPGTASHFVTVLDVLAERGLISEQGYPIT